MDSQGPSLSKGFPEQETGASDLSDNSNGREVIFFAFYNLLQAIFSGAHGVLKMYFEYVVKSFFCFQCKLTSRFEVCQNI